MFIGIPLLLIAASSIGMAFIALRKFSELKKISSDTQPQTSQNFFHSMFPEVFLVSQKLNVKGTMRIVLVELEKLLRKIRLALMATERISDRLIHSLRKVQKQQIILQNGSMESQNVNQAVEANHVVNSARDLENSQKDTFKAEEQRLILAIAKDPKDEKLYTALGEIYLKANNFQYAKESFQAALKLNPNDRELAQKLSIVLEKLLKKE